MVITKIVTDIDFDYVSIIDIEMYSNSSLFVDISLHTENRSESELYDNAAIANKYTMRLPYRLIS